MSRLAIAATTPFDANCSASQPKPSSDSSTTSSGLYSSHSPGREARVRSSAAAGASAAASGNASTVRAASPRGAVSHATSSDTPISAPVSSSDCHRKIVCVNGSTPVIGNSPGGMLAGFACSCAADELSPIAHTAPRPRYAAAPAAR